MEKSLHLFNIRREHVHMFVQLATGWMRRTHHGQGHIAREKNRTVSHVFRDFLSNIIYATNTLKRSFFFSLVCVSDIVWYCARNDFFCGVIIFLHVYSSHSHSYNPHLNVEFRWISHLLEYSQHTMDYSVYIIWSSYSSNETFGFGVKGSPVDHIKIKSTFLEEL